MSSGKTQMRTSFPSAPSSHSPMRGSSSGGTPMSMRMSNLSRLSVRLSNKALAAARDSAEPRAKSPGLIRGTGTARTCLPPVAGKCIPCQYPARDHSRCAQGQRESLPLLRLSWHLAGTAQRRVTASSQGEKPPAPWRTLWRAGVALLYVLCGVLSFGTVLPCCGHRGPKPLRQCSRLRVGLQLLCAHAVE